ncbi:MAG: hypothetical protein HQ518_18985 [Rhodopirellula sp.]|nr:hypothetical protein [Rhodopirellula sp.]
MFHSQTDRCLISSVTDSTSISEMHTVDSCESQQLRVTACWAFNVDIYSESRFGTPSPTRLLATLSASDFLVAGIVDAVRSDDPLRQPVDPGWFVGACQASLQECETVISLATRQIAANDETSDEYVRLKRLASRAVRFIPASMNQVSRPTALSRETWAVTAKACDALSAEADNFPFDGWVARCAEGCRQLAAVLRRAAIAGTESPLQRA